MGAMDEPVSRESRLEVTVAALARNDATQDGQIKELFQRVNHLERQQSAHGATLHGMQQDISEAKQAAQQANDKLDVLKMWMMGTLATTLVTAVMLLLQWAAKKP